MSRQGPAVWVAIPARDERARIVACLSALTRQVGWAGSLHIVVAADRCRDDTAAQVRTFAATTSTPITVLETAAGSAGRARRQALDWAAARAGTDAVLATTDADSRVAPDWLAATQAELDRGVEAVAGSIRFDPDELARAAPCPARRLEGRYAVLQAEISARTDPRPHDPWPNHLWAWGASLAVLAETYRAVGGLPATPLAEDRAFVDLLDRHDVRVRRSVSVRVTTSARLDGRAQGGLSRLVSDYARDTDAPCDAALEGAVDARRRALLRRRLRRAFARGEDRAVARVVARWGVPAAAADVILAERRFGARFAGLEAVAPILRRRRLRPDQLPGEIARAELILRRLRAGSDGPAGITAGEVESLWPETRSTP